MFFSPLSTLFVLRKMARCKLRESRRNLLLQTAVKRADAILRNRTLIYTLKFGNRVRQCASSRKHPLHLTNTRVCKAAWRSGILMSARAELLEATGKRFVLRGSVYAEMKLNPLKKQILI